MIAYEQLMALEIPEKQFAYDARDAMLYALATGYGADPMDRAELPFVYEKELRAAPTLATVIAWNDEWAGRTRIDPVRVVHGEMQVEWHRPLPPAAVIRARTRIRDAIDKGAGRGALLVIETQIREAAGGEPLCTNTSVAFARGDGGFGGPQRPSPPPHPIPAREPDHVVERRTQENQALFYRLCGDRNPLHADPDFAAAAGFPRPILHGLCTYGFAARALLAACCDHDPARLASFAVRFSAPVFPGETIRTELWRDGDTVSLRARVPERDIVVLNHGRAILRALR